MSDGVLLLEDELVDEGCPLHADLELGDLSSLSEYDRKWLTDIACPEVHAFFENARRSQLALQGDNVTARDREFHGRQLRMALRAVERTRADMERILRGVPRTSEPSRLELWDR